MLYDAYQAQRDALAPWRFFAETARSLIGQSGPIIGNLPLVRGTAAALTLLSRTGISDRKSTRLNSSHLVISYAVFCLKKKNTHRIPTAPHSEPYRHECPLHDVRQRVLHWASPLLAARGAGVALAVENVRPDVQDCRTV